MIALDEARDALLRAALITQPILVHAPQAAGPRPGTGPASGPALPPSTARPLDGYALRSSDLEPEGGELPCAGEIKAGDEESPSCCREPAWPS